MKNIGYIYKYNKKEGLGILVYGDLNPAIRFTKNDCLSAVTSEQLVYFDLGLDSENNNTAHQIEPASLSNFNRDILYGIITMAQSGYNKIKCTQIRFCEPKKHRVIREDPPKAKDEDDNIWDSIFKINEDALPSNSQYKVQYDYLDIPKDIKIDDLYHLFRGDSTVAEACIDIFDFNRWVDGRIGNNTNEYGETAEQVKDLYNLFIYEIEQVYIINHSPKVIPISDGWKKILFKLKDDELRLICKELPVLQKSLPRIFCMNNLDALSIENEFPSLSVCEAYYRYRIKNMSSTSEYVLLHTKITSISIKHKEYINKILEERYRNVVLKSLGAKLSKICGHKTNGQEKVQLLFSRKEWNRLINLGLYVDKYEYVISEYSDIDYIIDYKKAYEKLNEEDKALLKRTIQKRAKDCLINIARTIEGEEKGEIFYDTKNILSDYLNQKTYSYIIKIVKPEFDEVITSQQLWYIYKSNIITEPEFLNRYKKITRDYNLCQFLHIIYNGHEIPLSIQDYLIREILFKGNYSGIAESFPDDYWQLESDTKNKGMLGAHMNGLINCYGFKWLDVGNAVYGGYRMIRGRDDETLYEELPNKSIRKIETLLEWLTYNCNVDKELLNTIINEVTLDFSKEDRWYLFKKKIISSPSLDNIREKLDAAYSKKEMDDMFYYKACFQEEMVKDALSISNNSIIAFIISKLKGDYLKLANCDGGDNIHFFTWTYHLNENINWNWIRLYFHYLPEYIQIRIFKYLFYLYATRKVYFTIDELLFNLTNYSKHNISETLQVLLLFLKIKSKNISGIIPFSEIEKIIDYKELDIDETSLFENMADFFFVCQHHSVLFLRNDALEVIYKEQMNDDIETKKGHIEEKLLDGKKYYVVSLNEELLSTNEAVNVLKRNIPYKQNGKCFYIDKKYEIDILDFAIKYQLEDKCNLFKSSIPINKKYYFLDRADLINDETADSVPKSNYIFCKCDKGCRDVAPNKGIPFCWCDRFPCVQDAHFLASIDDWESYKFIDLLDIICDKNIDKSVLWNINAEISAFLNEHVLHIEFDDDGEGILFPGDSKSIDTTNEIGEWNDKMSVEYSEYQLPDYYNDIDDDYDNNHYDSSENRTYGRYAGSYAQDEMGYSDDDIDTLFDGDPSAYWNID